MSHIRYGVKYTSVVRKQVIVRYISSGTGLDERIEHAYLYSSEKAARRAITPPKHSGGRYEIVEFKVQLLPDQNHEAQDMAYAFDRGRQRQ